MIRSDFLTFCQNGCGNNFHGDCVARWVKYQISQGKKIQCPVFNLLKDSYVALNGVNALKLI